MKNGLADLAIIPLRKEPAHRAEMVSQLLFGELYRVLETRDEWMQVECAADGYVGWISAGQHRAIEESEYRERAALAPIYLREPFAWLDFGGVERLLPAGSSLACALARGAKCAGKLLREPPEFNEANLLSLTAMYLRAPYLWGGRTPMGIDCSGFAQATFRYFGKRLLRDAYLQADQGEAVASLADARAGDLVFFDEAGKITHVGILLSNRQVIHAAGYVKVSAIDERGILSSDATSANRYTHALRRIRRV